MKDKKYIEVEVVETLPGISQVTVANKKGVIAQFEVPDEMIVNTMEE